MTINQFNLYLLEMVPPIFCPFKTPNVVTSTFLLTFWLFWFLAYLILPTEILGLYLTFFEKGGLTNPSWSELIIFAALLIRKESFWSFSALIFLLPSFYSAFSDLLLPTLPFDPFLTFWCLPYLAVELLVPDSKFFLFTLDYLKDLPRNIPGDAPRLHFNGLIANVLWSPYNSSRKISVPPNAFFPITF